MLTDSKDFTVHRFPPVLGGRVDTERTAILNNTESFKEGVYFVQVSLELTTGNARVKLQIREAFHT